MKVTFHYNDNFVFDVDCKQPTDVYIDRIERHVVPKGHVRIVILEEPRKGLLYRIVGKSPFYYTHLLTFHEELLRKNTRAHRFLMMKPWVVDYRSPNKEFAVSTVVGGKKDPRMEGYAMRHNLWLAREAITVPRRFYLSGSAKHWHTFVPWIDVSYKNELVLGARKEPLFDSMFHVAIENTSIANYFSEKLLDCFQSRTVPIYYGCSNIGEFFDKRGIFVAHDVSEMISICNMLTPATYESMLPYVEENYERSKRWLDPRQQVEDKVKEILSQI